MLSRSAFLSGLFFYFSLASTMLFAQSEFDRLVDRVVSHRRAITSGVFDLVEKDLGSTSMPQKLKLTFDGNRFRQDVYVDDIPGIAPYTNTVVYLPEKKRSLGGSSRGPMTKEWRASIFPIDEKHWSQLNCIDPRTLGMMNSRIFAERKSTTTHHFADLVFFDHDWSLIGMTEGVSEMRDCVIGEYKKFSSKCQVWIDRDRTECVPQIKWSTRFKSAPIEIVETVISSEYKMIDEFGWFPSVIRLQISEDGRLTRSLEYQINVIQINEPVDEELFSFETMGMADGQLIYDFTSREDGKMFTLMELVNGQPVPKVRK